MYLARDTKHDRLVALKILRPELADTLAAERFLREIRVAAGLQHASILHLYDSGETENSLYFVMPYMEGETLRHRMSRERHMHLADAVAVVREIADGLTFAHERGVVHRDVKPENIILGGGHAFIADFGIAQALSVANTAPRTSENRLTGGGFVVGTPAYMSPEQASGGDSVDGRSDQYSLACVLFEMLAGQPPHTGTTPIQLMSQRLHRKPKRIRRYRKDISRAVDAVLTRAMQPEPSRRFGNVREFAEELARVAATSSLEVRRQRLAALLAGAASVAFAALVLNWITRPERPVLDPTLYVVIPFEHDSAAASRLGGDNCQLLLSTAFSHWRGLRIVDQMRANSAYAQMMGERAPTLERVLDAARALRAGTAAWGSVRSVGDSVYVRASLYDVSSGESIREFQVALANTLDGLSAKFRQLADTLLLHVAGAPTTADAMGTTSLDAWRAYSEGHRALATWNLPAAHAAFARATEIDPDYAHAWFWLVQSMTWSRTFGRDWRDAAARAVALNDRLAPQDRELSLALLELAEGQFPQTCQRYRALIAADSLNFRAWFGLGECQSLDRIVIPDRASPTGWRFRASQHDAIEAYRRALSLTPATFMAFRGRAFDRLEALLFANPAHFRQGFIVNAGDTTVMGAFPALVGDTIAFVPYTLAQVFDLNQARPPTHEAAVARNRGILLEVTRSWSRAFPRSADAVEAHASALENVVALTSPPGENARDRFNEARALSAEPEQQARLAVSLVRVLLRSRDFEAAGRLADSIATALRGSDDAPAARASMAALTGRIRLAADFAAQGADGYTMYLRDGRRLRPPMVVGAAALRARIYAAFGVSADTLRTLTRRVQQEINRWMPPAERAAAGASVMEPVAAIGFEQLGASEYHERPTLWLSGVQRMELRGDRAALLASLDSLIGDHLANAESVYHGARLALRIGDTARANAALDSFIDGLPTDGDHMLYEPSVVAAIGRVLALRAELARRTEPARARELAGAVVSLWRSPDPELLDALRLMRQIIAN